MLAPWKPGRLATALGAAMAIACGATDEGADGNGSSTETSDATGEPDIAVPCGLAFGEPCHKDEQCDSGLCLVSEYAPFGVCTVRCQDAPNFCVSEAGEQIEGAWCIEFPDGEFNVLSPVDIGPFCVPMCDSLGECKAISSAYELCEEPLHRGNPLYGDAELNRSVCQAPSTAGKVPVDPFTCAEWEVTNPGFGSEKNLCRNYCTFLKSCQYYEPTHNMECCAWYCYLELVPNDVVNGPYEDVLVNHWQWFTANAGTAQQCRGEDKFGVPPLPDAKAPPDPAGQCNMAETEP